jgi:hypothetical protein
LCIAAGFAERAIEPSREGNREGALNPYIYDIFW